MWSACIQMYVGTSERGLDSLNMKFLSLSLIWMKKILFGKLFLVRSVIVWKKLELTMLAIFMDKTKNVKCIIIP